MATRLGKHWFTIGLLLVVGVALAFPGVEEAFPRDYVVKPAIFGILLFISASLSTDSIVNSLKNIKGLAAVFLTNYVGFTVVVGAFALLPLSPGIEVGFVIVAAVPTTLASATIFTSTAKGNAALSLASTLALNALSFVLTPLVIFVLLSGHEIIFSQGQIMLLAKEMFLLVLIPVAIGQGIRKIPAVRRSKLRLPLSFSSQILILIVVLSSVAGASDLISGGIKELSLFGILLMVLLLHALMLMCGWYVSGLLRLPRYDRVAVVFSGSQKTLPLGVFLASVHFPFLSLALIPIILYHPIQLLLDSLVISYFGKSIEQRD